MTVGGSIFLIAVGAILRYAVEDEIDAVNLETVGLILMIAGILGLLIGLFLMTQNRGRGDVVYERPAERVVERPVEYERRDPPAR
jgi:hypothetical protein